MRLHRLVVVMARWPAPGRCKRRLAAGLGASRAAAVQLRLQQHTHAVLDQACSLLALDRRLALSGAGLRAAGRSGWAAVVPQGQGSLGLRMQRQFATAFRQGYRQVVLLGSDLPELAVSDLQQAFAALDHSPLVLGPAVDGGYWLVGLTRPAAGLFSGIAWGSERVLHQTLERAAALELPAALLQARHDLDRPSDLRRWR